MVQLIGLLGERNFVKVLVFFLRNPSLEIHQQELKKKVKLAKTTLIKWLKVLVEFNVLKVKKFGIMKVYSLNREMAIVKHLKVLDTISSLSVFRKLFEKYKVKVYLYGSCSRGEDREKSDVDILIIGKIKKEKIIRDVENISNKIKRKIKVIIFSPLEWAEMVEKDKAFYERVEKDKIELY